MRLLPPHVETVRLELKITDNDLRPAMESRISRLIDSLPTLTKDDVDLHDLCSICFVDFKTILDDNSSDPEGTKPAGLTILSGCKHVFCKNEYVLLSPHFSVSFNSNTLVWYSGYAAG
jgi:hypothetical protein